MDNHQKQFEQLINGLSQTVGLPLSIEDGICALADDNGDIVINMELPETGNRLLLHRELMAIPDSPEIRHGCALQMLALNGLQLQMHGHWLCIDPDGLAIHLMTSHPIETLKVEQLALMADHFLQLGSDLASYLQQEVITVNRSAPRPNQGIQP